MKPRHLAVAFLAALSLTSSAFAEDAAPPALPDYSKDPYVLAGEGRVPPDDTTVPYTKPGLAQTVKPLYVTAYDTADRLNRIVIFLNGDGVPVYAEWWSRSTVEGDVTARGYNRTDDKWVFHGQTVLKKK